MANATDMSTPVTRGELRAELKRFATKADLKKFATKAELRQAVKKLATKADLEIWGGALWERINESERKLTETLTETLTESLTKKLKELLAETEQRLSADLAQHTKAHRESLSKDLSAMDDKYKSLPARVQRLEAKVFPDKQR
jgi:hypothetical protein